MVLVVTMVAMLVGTAYAGQLLRTSRSAGSRVESGMLRVQAEWLAQAGLDSAVSGQHDRATEKEWSWSTTVSESEGLTATVTVTVTESTPVQATSVAVLSSAGRQVAQVTKSTQLELD